MNANVLNLPCVHTDREVRPIREKWVPIQLGFVPIFLGRHLIGRTSRSVCTHGHTNLKSCSVIFSPRFPTYNVLMDLSSGGSSLGMVVYLFSSLSATGSLTP